MTLVILAYDRYGVQYYIESIRLVTLALYLNPNCVSAKQIFYNMANLIELELEKTQEYSSSSTLFGKSWVRTVVLHEELVASYFLLQSLRAESLKSLTGRISDLHLIFYKLSRNNKSDKIKISENKSTKSENEELLAKTIKNQDQLEKSINQSKNKAENSAAKINDMKESLLEMKNENLEKAQKTENKFNQITTQKNNIYSFYWPGYESDISPGQNPFKKDFKESKLSKKDIELEEFTREQSKNENK